MGLRQQVARGALDGFGRPRGDQWNVVLRRGFSLILSLLSAALATGAAAQTPDPALANGVSVFGEGEPSPPNTILGVVYEHRWSLPGRAAPDSASMYESMANQAKALGANLIVEFRTGTQDPLIQGGPVRWLLGLAARTPGGLPTDADVCDNCIVEWTAMDPNSLESSDGEFLSTGNANAFRIARLRLAEMGYYLRDAAADSVVSSVGQPSTLDLEFEAKRDPASPEDLSFAARLIWRVSGAAAWRHAQSMTSPSSKYDPDGMATLAAVTKLYENLPRRPPTPDSDGDGIPDSRDRSPDTPEGAVVDNDGIAKDDDGDGVPNGIDRAPYTPFGVPVDQYGRPLDLDGDGVPDHQDACLDTPAHFAVDARGCPKEEWITVIEDVLIDQGVLKERLHFGLGSAILQSTARARLDTIGVALSGLPDLLFSVDGHCDDQGSDDFNDLLSRARAQAVVRYLVGTFRELHSTQFEVHGWGKRRLDEPGMTDEARARNRRVEFVVKNPEEARRLVKERRFKMRGEPGPATQK